MALFLLALGLLLLGGLSALAGAGSARRATRIGVTSAVLGCALGTVSVLRVLTGGPPVSLRIPWDVPYGAFSVGIDALSAFFLLVVFVVSGVAAIYGGEYLLRAPGHGSARRLGSAWFFYNLLVAAMAMVLAARNGVLFLVAWEVMALASYFLVTFEDDDAAVCDAGRTYLVATHLGTAFLLALFALLGSAAGSFDFDRFAAAGPLSPTLAGALFLLGVVGFGGKAGLVPFHVWLPEAHPAAPSHVSAVMSGAMIQVGVYGLLRLVVLLGPPPLWWGWVLAGLGLVSAGAGVLFALAQHDLKRLLAYSSVENVGIVVLGLGIGMIGLAVGAPVVAVLGFAGGLLHVANHALMKGLLFLGAGAVAQGTGTRAIDRMGGLLRRMPATGGTFLIGSVAICGLPPLCGFTSEFLVYLGGLRGGTAGPVGESLPALAAVAGLSLIGGLSAAAFAKAFGVVFLGEPRTEGAAKAGDAGPAMKLSLGLLAGGSIVAGLASPWLVGGMGPIIAGATGLPPGAVAEGLAACTGPLRLIVLVAGVALAAALVLAGLRRRLLSGRTVERAGTWGSGYARPTARMQYTGSSFVQPLTGAFRAVLGTRRRAVSPSELFPRAASFATTTPDAVLERIVLPSFAAATRALASLRFLQHGRLNLYMLYIALTLVVLLVWKMG